MFAVPGWSVSADVLKPQVDRNAHRPSDGATSEKLNKNPKKRRRGHGSGGDVEITEENLGDLWSKHVEKKTLDASDGNTGFPGQKQKRKRRKETEVAFKEAKDVNGDTWEGFSDGSGKIEAQQQEKPLKKKNKNPKENEEAVETSIQRDGRIHAIEDMPSLEGLTPSSSDGKTKFEQRKAKAAEKREKKALLEANGILPPSRADPVPFVSTENTAPIPPKISSEEFSKPKEQCVPEPIVRATTLDASKSLRELPPPKLPDPPPSFARLTPLQQRMAAKLTSARFRHLNQTLYTSPSNQAMQLFTESPQAYSSYHTGFRAQVAVWPQNPVEGFIEDIKTRASVSIPSQKKMWRDQKRVKKPKAASIGTVSANGDSIKGVEPLPRSRHNICTIADLGCGDATLASSLEFVKMSLNLNILSFDLAKGDTPNAQLITVADISNLQAAGVKDGTIDIAICCLSLMGTNWVEAVGECARAVRGGGEFWVAEIKSRFARPGPVTKGKKDGGIGKRKAKSKAEDDVVDEEPANLVEVEEDGDTRGKDETDVSAFVEVFRKRGFNLKGEPDMSNKMFVRMRFTKALRPEKVAENEKGGAAKFGEGFKGKQRAKPKFVEDGEEVDESKVLKPCVYKTR